MEGACRSRCSSVAIMFFIMDFMMSGVRLSCVLVVVAFVESVVIVVRIGFVVPKRTIS